MSALQKTPIKSQWATKWQKISTKHISDQGAISRAYKEVIQFMIKSYDKKTKRETTEFSKMAKRV